MSRRILISLALAAVQAAVGGEKLFACGGAYIPDCTVGNDDQLLRSPPAEFLAELRRVFPRYKPRRPTGRSTWRITQEAGLGDLKAALTAARAPGTRRKKVLQGYRSLRKHLRKHYERLAALRSRRRWMSEEDRRRAKPPKFQPPTMPNDLPREFDLYLRGAIAWNHLQVEAARRQWRAVLGLPAGQRKFRSVWAAYMLGRSYVGKDPDQVVKWLVLSRKLAASGFADSAGLAAASSGWQGWAELHRGNRLTAIRLYVDQLIAGDRTAPASLRICAKAVLRGGAKELDRAAADKVVRRVLTAYLAAGPSPYWIASAATGKKEVRAWLAALAKAGVRNLPGAGRLARAAYRTGLMRQAQRWADRAPKKDVIACWVRAKLLLRAGKIDAAAAQLATALKSPVPAEYAGERQRPQAAHLAKTLAWDLASLRLNRRQYAETLDLLTTHAHHEAAAYLAERVLTLPELIAYVDPRAKEERLWTVRSVLACRLVRAGRWKDARGYFLPAMRVRLDAYIAAVRKGHDRKVGRAARADAFWEAAKGARQWGSQLMGYHTGWYGADPDGTFHPWREFRRTGAAEQFTIAPPSKDERRRVERHRPRPVERWHYLYEAVAHAWRACELMPDNDETTARRLWEAGTWIKFRDPKAADPFYKAMVRRCGNTRLGKEAARLHWFPKTPPAAND